MSGQHIPARKVAADANAWAARIRHRAATQAPGLPPPVVIYPAAPALPSTPQLPAKAVRNG